MFKKVLLPLDGSDLAEAVLPYGEELARKLGGELILLHVCEPSHQLACTMHSRYMEKTAEIVQARLDKSGGKKAKVRAEVIKGDFTKEICNYIDENEIRLLVMVAHGFTSLKAKLMGSITDKVFRLVSCPTLLVRTEVLPPAEEKKLIKRIILPLDGTDNDDTSIPYAIELARGINAEVALYRMAPRAHYVAAKDDVIADIGLADERVSVLKQQDAEDYLKEIEKRFSKEGLKTSTTVSLGDDPAKAITEAGKKLGANLVVMASRGHTPVASWASGSIAHKLLSTGDLPLIIIKQDWQRPNP